MSKTVRVENGIVREIIPAEATIPSVAHWYGVTFAAECRDAPDGVQQGWVYDGQNFNPPAGPSLNEIRALKVAELSAATELVIYAGVDVTTPTFGTRHYTLDAHDQTQLEFLGGYLAQGAPGYLYNAVDQDHEFYPAADLALIITAGTSYITYRRTYYSELKKWVNRETDVDVINSITIDSALPDDLAADLGAKLAMLQ